MNDRQRKFLEHIAAIQENCVESCLIEHNRQEDKETKSMLYDATYNITARIMEMIDGCSEYSSDRHDIINTITGEHLKENPFIELHDQLEEFMKY